MSESAHVHARESSAEEEDDVLYMDEHGVGHDSPQRTFFMDEAGAAHDSPQQTYYMDEAGAAHDAPQQVFYMDAGGGAHDAPQTPVEKAREDEQRWAGKYLDDTRAPGGDASRDGIEGLLPGVTMRGSTAVEDRAEKRDAVLAGLGAVAGAGYAIPEMQVILGESGSSNPNVATMVDPVSGDDSVNLYLSDQKLLSHSKMLEGSDAQYGMRGGLRDAQYQEGGIASGERGVADQHADPARKKAAKSQAMAMAIVVHEVGHVLHAKHDPDAFWALKASGAMADGALAAEVSQYATRNALEFVAEVFTGRTLGLEYSAQVMAEYSRLGGPTPPAPDAEPVVADLDELDVPQDPEPVEGPADDEDAPVGAGVPTNWHTEGLTGDDATGVIHHSFSWESVSGDLGDLAGVKTREVVEFDRDPLGFMPAYGPYAAMDGRADLDGKTLVKEGADGALGRAGDDHSPGYGPYFRHATLGIDNFVKQEGRLGAIQTYEYQLPGTTEWVPFPGATFTIVRTMERVGSVFKSYYLTTTKTGEQGSATARVKMKNQGP